MSESLKQMQLYESLSALIDNEASELEVHRVLAESERDAALRTRWHRYQLARSAMKGELVSSWMGDISDAVRRSVAGLNMDTEAQADGPETAAESGTNTTTESPSRRLTGWQAHVGRLAIAASVAGAVLFGAQQANLVAQQTEPGLDVAEQAMPVDSDAEAPVADIALPPVNLQTVGGNLGQPQSNRLPQQTYMYSPTLQQQQLQDERVRLYIQQLMLEHAQHSARNSNAGMLPFARVPEEARQ